MKEIEKKDEVDAKIENALEWKDGGSVTGTGSINLPSSFKELNVILEAQS